VVRYALELKKPVMLLNVGPSRADALSGVEKIDMPSGSVMREVARAVMYVFLVLESLSGIPKLTGFLAELERSKILLLKTCYRVGLSGRQH
jgi:NADH:ubiquinone oxidoreductase subunit 2 (subunit N)